MANIQRDFPRSIRVGVETPAGEQSVFVDNIVKTSTYTGVNFVPKNLWLQFHEPANIYFLVIGVLQCIPEISTSNGVPNIYVPLVFILCVSALRAAVEDYSKHKADAIEASKEYLVLDRATKQFLRKQSGSIVVGDIVKMVYDKKPASKDYVPLSDSFPSDLLFLSSGLPKGNGFVETASLDGETNLKNRGAVQPVHELVWGAQKGLPPPEEELHRIMALKLTLQTEVPNPNLKGFKGFMYFDGDTSKAPYELKAENLMLRNTNLRNTPYMYGLVIYTGTDTKIRQNVTSGGGKGKVKRSSLMKTTDRMLAGMAVFQVVMCFIAAILAGSWHGNHKDDAYLDLTGTGGWEGFLRFFTWFIILSQMVPISLQVSMELVKFFQALLIKWDLAMYYAPIDLPANVLSSQLNEDLGQIQYVFTDKTGTLTQNKMEFRVGYVNDLMFGDAESEIARRVEKRKAENAQRQAGKAVAPSKPWSYSMAELQAQRGDDGLEIAEYIGKAHVDRMLQAAWGPPGGEPENPELAVQVRKYLLSCALSNTITPDWKVEDPDDPNSKKELVFQFTSPDELAIVKFAQHMGYELQSRANKQAVVKIDKKGFGDKAVMTETFRHLALLDFNPKRKRVTLIYQLGSKVLVMCKGQDGFVLPLVRPKTEQDNKLIKSIQDQLVDMGSKALRTMAFVYAELPLSWWTGTDGEPGADADWKAARALPDEGDEAKHDKGECKTSCRLCTLLEQIERKADMSLIGASCLEDRLQDLVPECIEDFLKGNIKVWMLTGDKLPTAKNIGMACNLIDPDMEKPETMATQVEELSRLLPITGQWYSILQNEHELKQIFDQLAKGEPAAVNRNELQMYLVATCFPGAEDSTFFAEHWDSVDALHEGKIDFRGFVAFMRGTKLTKWKAIYADLKTGLRRVAQIGPEMLPKFPISVLVDGSALGVMYPERKIEGLTDPIPPEELLNIQRDFFLLTAQSKSVVCCELTPKQKGQIVKEVQERVGAVTLAVGDGGNDCVMIRQANIGVGIAGLEGMDAAKAGEYAIGQFHHLHPLIFVHGAWSYRRISTLVYYIFYKASLVSLTMFFFGFHSGFSGQQLFNDYIYQLYNVVFTALPILVLSVFDRGLTRPTLDDFPQAYASVQEHKWFSKKMFFVWIFRALLSALFIYFMVVGATENEVLDSSGRTPGLWFNSTLIFECVVILSTLRILLEMSSLTWLHHLSVWGSFGVFLLLLFLLNVSLTFNGPLYSVVDALYSSGTAWLTLLLLVTIPLATDFFAMGLRRQLYPTVIDVLQEREKLTPKQLNQLAGTHHMPISIEVHVATDHKVETFREHLVHGFGERSPNSDSGNSPGKVTVPGRDMASNSRSRSHSGNAPPDPKELIQATFSGTSKRASAKLKPKMIVEGSHTAPAGPVYQPSVHDGIAMSLLRQGRVGTSGFSATPQAFQMDFAEADMSAASPSHANASASPAARRAVTVAIPDSEGQPLSSPLSLSPSPAPTPGSGSHQPLLSPGGEPSSPTNVYHHVPGVVPKA